MESFWQYKFLAYIKHFKFTMPFLLLKFGQDFTFKFHERCKSHFYIDEIPLSTSSSIWVSSP